MAQAFSRVTRLFASTALLPDGWAENVLLEVDEAGWIRRLDVGASAEDTEQASGPLLPGMPNLHGHAFQRAMAGLAERAATAEDSFWTWREVMYGFVQRLGPEEAEAIAAQAYLEMLEAGYTAAAEFHYLHHAPDGTAYEEPGEMGQRHLAAARRVGMGLTLLPVLYAHGGFGGAEPGEGQRRFVNHMNSFFRIVESLRKDTSGDPDAALGIAPHSLRAVTPEQLREAVASLGALDPEAPIHIHVAEQLREVADCLLWSGRRPVRWLLENQQLDARWCLIHATHMDSGEVRDFAASGAIAGLCPTTEANLGDGIFPASDYMSAGGRWGIGSDSHVTLDPWAELRLLEYGQRLTHRRRNLLRPATGGSVGLHLYRRALVGGAQACGRPIGELAVGRRADLVVLDPSCSALWGKAGDQLLDAAVFAANRNPVLDVAVGGRWVVREGRHPLRETVARDFREAVARLL